MTTSPLLILLCLLGLLANLLSAWWEARHPRSVFVSEDELLS